MQNLGNFAANAEDVEYEETHEQPQETLEKTQQDPRMKKRSRSAGNESYVTDDY